ncbi:MAG: ATP-binding protein [Candidatus Heimdallarchaeota archaeon]|nr:ATP-binding protein [Candidatus Heimdallarchaeota archaeon]
MSSNNNDPSVDITTDEEIKEIINLKDETYDASSIKVLEGTEGIRERPSMYIGDTSKRGFHHLVYEVIDNSIDEAMAGRGSQVEVIIHPDNSISIRDDGAGIPASNHPTYNVSTLEVILTKIHSGGKFDNKAYKVSGGLHGVGLAAVCALSEDFLVKSYRDGKIYTQRYKDGKKVTEVSTEPLGNAHNGTLIHFKPDSKIFVSTKGADEDESDEDTFEGFTGEFDYDELAVRFHQIAYLTPGFKIIFTDKRRKDEDGNFITNSYLEEGGLVSYVKYFQEKKRKAELLDTDAEIFYTMGMEQNVRVEVALTYVNDFKDVEPIGFVNNIHTGEGGTHITGFKRTLTRVLKEHAKELEEIEAKNRKKAKKGSKKSVKDDPELSSRDLREGLIAIISTQIPSPQFEGQTKTKLGNSEIVSLVSSVMMEPFKHWLKKNERLGKEIINKAKRARDIRIKASKFLKDQRKGSSAGRLPGKLVNARTKDASKRELYLVEGQSAGGTAVKARDSEYQEILFLRGKVLNVEKARLDRAMENAEIRNIITAINAGHHDEFNITTCRYGKVILLTDADVDGAHIATLLFTFFYRYMKPLIEEGRLYIARTPLYQLEAEGELKKIFKEGLGQEYRYFYTEKEKDYEMRMYEDMKYTLKRFKGLGEMNPDQLKETSMNFKTRKIDKVLIREEINAEEWLSNLMGDDVEPRRIFINKGVFSEKNINSRGDFYNLAFDLPSVAEKKTDLMGELELADALEEIVEI